jgi:WD40 repeat protein
LGKYIAYYKSGFEEFLDSNIFIFQDWGSVTAISFRSDGPAMMVTGTGAGHVLLWDLEKKASAGQMWNAHYGPVTGLRCLPCEPIMVTSSSDNSLKVSNILNQKIKNLSLTKSPYFETME